MTLKDDSKFTQVDPALAPGTEHEGFEVVRADVVPEISATVYQMRHTASGARLAWIAADDENRSFAIGFKTPPKDDTGVFHIIEHSVLDGSDRYPVKEPFVHLLKSSMQTFLNALTYPDKTVYPVASTNIQDLENLMSVYLDAVFHPSIYKRPRIFEQEGWHYELVEDGSVTQLIYNGVVFNEMKGSLSDPDEVLFNALLQQMFPDSPYRFESGGDPRAIPTLTYEEFLDEHARHYNLANSYTFLYGDLDINRELALIAQHFAGVEDRSIGAPNPLPLQEPVQQADRKVEMATPKENAAAMLGYMISTYEDPERISATSILFDALMGSNEAPLKRALMEADLAADVNYSIVDDVMQPFLIISLKGSKDDAAARLRNVFEQECARIVEDGIDKTILEASLSHAEFQLRERDFGFFTNGIASSIQMLAGWLYNEDAALDFLRYEEIVSHLREGLAANYYEQLLKSVVLESVHTALVELVPSAAQEADEEEVELAEKLATLSEDDRAAITREVEALRAEQTTPDSEEALATLPRLTVADIGDAPKEPESHNVEAAFPLTRHDIQTNGINYLYAYFGLDCVSYEELPYVGILCDLLGKLDTRDHTAQELDTLIEGNLGNLSFFTETFVNHADNSKLRPVLAVGTSALTTKVEAAATIPQEVWSSTNFHDAKRVRALLEQRRIGKEQHFLNSGHLSALNRAAAGLRKSALISQQIGGVDAYLFLKDLLDDFDNRFEGLADKLTDLAERIFSKGNLEVSFVGTNKDLTRWLEAASGLSLKEEIVRDVLSVPEPQCKAEGFALPGNVCYVAEALDTHKLGVEASGVWDVVSRAITYGYLWGEVREKGGAYGCGFRFSPTAVAQLYSYRDPAVDPTLERYASAGTWLKAWNPSNEEFEGFVVSVVAGYDAPEKPRAQARKLDTVRMCERPKDWHSTLRGQALACTLEDVHAQADSLAQLSDQASICVFGDANLLRASKSNLDIVELMEIESAE